MKILMLGWELPPHNSGGMGVACYELSRCLTLDGVSVDFVVPYQAEHGIKEFKVHSATDISSSEILAGGAGAYQSCSYGCKLVRGCEHRPHTTDLRSLQKHYARYVESVAGTLNPSVIHAHDWLTFEAGVRAKKITGKPLVAHVHATEFDRAGSNAGNPLVHDIEYNGLMMADRVIAVSQITKDIIVEKYQIEPDKVEVIHNGIDSSVFDGIDSTAQQTYVYLDAMKRHGYSVVVSLGRLTVQKGLTFLLEAAARASQVNDKLLFLIAGNGDMREELIEKSAELGIADKVLFTGFIRGKQWRDAYRVGDMFVMSSVSEPFGLSALEAAGYGNAVVITKQSGVGEVLRSAMRYDFWDTERLANQMIAISSHRSLQNELVDGAYEEFGKFSWYDVSQKCLRVYKSHAEVTA